MARKFWFIEIRMMFAPIVLGQFGNSFAGHGASQKPRSHRRVNDHSDIYEVAVGQNPIFDLATDQGIWGLERRNRRDALRQLHWFDIEVGDADPADLSLLL